MRIVRTPVRRVLGAHWRWAWCIALVVVWLRWVLRWVLVVPLLRRVASRGWIWTRCRHPGVCGIWLRGVAAGLRGHQAMAGGISGVMRMVRVSRRWHGGHRG